MAVERDISAVQKVKDQLAGVEDAVSRGVAEQVEGLIKDWFAYARLVAVNNPGHPPALIFGRPDVNAFWNQTRDQALGTMRSALVQGFAHGAQMGTDHAAAALKAAGIDPTGIDPGGRFIQSALTDFAARLDQGREQIVGSVTSAYAQVGPVLSYQQGGASTNVPHDTAIARWDAARTQADKTARATGRSAADHSRYAAHEGYSQAQLAQVPAGMAVKKMWVANFAQDPKRGPCLTCIALHGTVVGLHEQFPHGLTYAKKPLGVYQGVLAGPPRHPNCRCRLVLITEPTEPTKAAQHAKDVEKVSAQMNEYAMKVVTDTFVTKGFTAAQVRSLPTPLFTRLWRFLRTRGWWRRIWNRKRS